MTQSYADRLQRNNRLEEEHLDAKYVHGTGSNFGENGKRGKKMSDSDTNALINAFERE